MTNNANVKKIIDWLADLANKGDAILEDKKVSWTEALSLVPNLMSLPALIPVFPLAKDEWVNADNDSKADVTQYAESKFDFANDKVEKKVEASLGIIVHFGTLLEK